MSWWSTPYEPFWQSRASFHMVVCSAALSSDFMVKVVEVSDSSQQKTLRGHEAPVLSVAFDPKDDYLVGNPPPHGVKGLLNFKNVPATVLCFVEAVHS